MTIRKEQKYKTILFDFDGTLADTFSLSLQCANALAKVWHYKELEDSYELRGKSLRTLIVAEMGLKWYHKWKFTKEVAPVFEAGLDSVEIFKGVKQVLLELSKNYSLGIVSSNKKRFINRILHNHDIAVFDFIVSESSLFGKHKVLKWVLKKYKLNKHETIYIGDEIRDVQACRKINLNMIAVSWGYNHKEALYENGAQVIVACPNEIIDFFR